MPSHLPEKVCCRRSWRNREVLRKLCAERGKEILRGRYPNKDFVFWGVGTQLLTPEKYQGQVLPEKLERWCNAAQSHECFWTSATSVACCRGSWRNRAMLRKLCAEAGKEILSGGYPNKEFVFWGMGTQLMTPKKIKDRCCRRSLRDGSMLRRAMTGPNRGTGRHQHARFSHENTRQNKKK